MKNREFKTLFAVLFLIIFLYGFINFFVSNGGLEAYKDAVFLREGWTVKTVSETVKNVDISHYRYHSKQRGDALEYSIKLGDIEVDAPTLELYTVLSKVSVYLDSGLIYSYGDKEYVERRMIGGGYHFISLPDDCSGKTLTITLTSENGKDMIWINPPVINDGTNEMRDFIKARFIYLCASIGMIVLGACFIFIAIIMGIFNRIYLQWLYAGLFVLALGLWFWSYTGTIMLITNDLAVKSTVEYISLYSFPLFAMLFTYELEYGMRVVKWKSVIKGFVIFDSLVLGLTLVLYIAGIVYLSELLSMYHMIMVVHIVFFIIICIYYLKTDKNKHYSLLIYGLFFMFICSISAFIFFYVNRLKQLKIDYVSISIVFGTSVFITTLIFTTVRNVLRELSKGNILKIKNHYLTLDAQIGIGNRLAIIEKIRKIRKNDTLFTVLGYYVANLNLFNKEFGFKEGDFVLSEIVKCLDIKNRNSSLVYRLRENGIAVILIGSNRVKVQEYIDETADYIKNFSKENYGITLDLNIGVLYSDENELYTPENILSIVDLRMMDKAGVESEQA